MAVNIGPQIGLNGEAAYTKSLKNIIAQSKALQAEMKAVTSAFDANDSSQKKLESQINVLNKQIETQQQRVKLLGDAYTQSSDKADKLNQELQDAVSKYGATSTEAQKAANALDKQQQAAQRARTEYLNATTALNKMTSELGSLTSETNQVATPMERLTDTIAQQQRELEQLQSEYSNAVLEFGKGSSSAQRLAREIDSLSGDLQENQKRADDATYQIDDLGDSFDDAGDKAASFSDIIGGTFLGNVLSDLASNAAQAIGGLAGEALDASDSLLKFESTMDFAGFDSSTIEQTSAAMQQYAAETVYDLETVSNTVAQLGANGVDNFEALTEAAGNLNAVAGGNADTFQSVAQVLTQTAGAGKLTTENWNQLTDAIPGASGVLQQAMLDAGAYTGNFREAMEDGEISAEEFNAAIMQLGQSDAAVQAAQSVSTIEGAVGNLQATITDMITGLLADGGTEMITGMINQVTAGFQALGEWVSANKEQILQFFQGIFDGISQFGTFVVDHWEIIVSGIVAVGGAIVALKLADFASKISGVITGVTSLASAFPALGSAISVLTNPVALVGAAVVGLVTLIATKGDEIQAILQSVDDFLQGVFATDWTESFGVLGNVLNGFFAGLKNIWDSIMDIFNGVIDFIRGVFTGDWERAWNGVKEIFSGIFNGLVNIVRVPLNGIIGILNGVIGGINMLIDGLNSISFDIPSWVPGIGGKTFGFNIGHIGSIPYLASGGIVRSGSAIVGEAGPELMTVFGNRTVVQPLPASYSVPSVQASATQDKAIINAITAATRSIVQAVQANGGEIVIGDDVIYRSYNRERASRAIVTGGAY